LSTARGTATLGTIAIPSYYRQITVAVPWKQREENSPNPRSHIEPLNNYMRKSLVINDPFWRFMESVTEAMALGYGLIRKALMRVTSSWLEGGSRASPESAAVLEVVREASGCDREAGQPESRWAWGKARAKNLHPDALTDKRL